MKSPLIAAVFIFFAGAAAARRIVVSLSAPVSDALGDSATEQFLQQAGFSAHEIGTFAALLLEIDEDFAADGSLDVESLVKSHPILRKIDPSLIKSVIEDDEVSIDAAPWGLDRIDQQSLPLDGVYKSVLKEKRGNSANKIQGANIYILDTGINARHPEIAGLVQEGASFVPDEKTTDDGHGHGTFVAGTVCSRNYGVMGGLACKLYPVKILSGETGTGRISWILAGIQHIVDSFKKHGGITVVNMSLGTSKSDVVNAAVNAAVDLGIHFVVSAGNEGADACAKSPASSGSSVTVGATDKNDKLATFSNYGQCVDIYAPGVDIIGLANPSGLRTLQGTSMATPFVTGVLASLLSIGAVPNSPAAAKEKLKALASDSVRFPAGSSSALVAKSAPKLLFTETHGGSSSYQHDPVATAIQDAFASDAVTSAASAWIAAFSLCASVASF